MTSSDPPTSGEPTCRILYRTPEPLTIEDATRLLGDTMAVVSFAASTATIPAEQLPSERTRILDDWVISWSRLWRRSKRGRPSREDELAAIMPVRRISYASPFEIVLSAPEHYVAATGAALWLLPTVIARFSRLRVRFARDRMERDVYDAMRERIKNDDVLRHLDAQAFDGLFSIERAITKDADKTVDSETVDVDDLDEFHKFLDEYEKEEGPGDGPASS
jgi:hypothetical protein